MRQAIAITDYWFDRSVENTFPINTIVTPPEISADYWIKVFDTFERKGDGNLNIGFTELRRSPYEFRETPDSMLQNLRSIYKIIFKKF